MPQSTEIVFPRGGKQRARKPKFKSSKCEDLFKTEVENDAPPHKKRKKQSSKSEPMKVNEPVVIQNLSLQSVAEGMVFLGCIMEIEDYSLKISLPGCLYGTVPIINISDNYTKLIKAFADNPGSVDEEVATLQSLFRVGQTFPCKVMSTNISSSKSGRNQITLSINPQHVNEGLRPASIMDGMLLFCAVQSVEDHGYILDIGINNCPAFLSHDSMLEYVRYHNDGHSLSIGHIVPAVVNMPALSEGQLHNGQAVALIANPNVMKSKMKVSRDISLHVLTPGTVVDSVIQKVTESGLVVDCLGFPGCVHKNHTKKPSLQHSNYIKGQTVQGTVLYVHPITRVIHITMHSKPNNKKFSKMFGDLKRWTVVDDAIITAVNKHSIFLKLRGNVQGIAFEKELSDEPIQNVIKTFSVNDTVQCRVIALHYLDNMVSVSLKKSILNQIYLSREDVTTGAVYEGKVKKLVTGGMVVTLSPGVQGFVRDIYMADVPVTKPELMFPKGKRVKCKVLHIDRTSSPPSILLTCKKGMLQTKLPILSSYQDASPGVITKGAIVNIKDNGLVLSFLNKVQGWVPGSEMGAYKIQDPEKVFFRGQVVKCRVLNCYPEEEKLFLSLRVDNSKLFGDKDMSKEKFAVGTVVKVKITKKTEKGVDVVIKGTKFDAFLPVGHLSDHIENCQKLLETYKLKDIIDVLCFSSKGVPIVTRKSSLLKAAENGVFHNQLSDFKEQTVLPVVVKHFAKYGMFIDLGYNIRGLVPNKFLADRKILKPEEAGYVIQQTLLARVIQVDTESNRIELSTKMMDVYHQEYNYGVDLLQSYFGDLNKMNEYYVTLDNTKSKLARMVVGSVVLSRVTSVTEIGVLCELPDGLKGFATNHHCCNEVMEENEERHGVILYIDMENECIELSFSPQLVRNVLKVKDSESCKVRIDQVIKCEVLVIKKEFILISLGGHAVGRFAYLPARRALNDLVGRQDLYTIGQHYHVVVMKVLDNGIVLGVLKQHVHDLQAEHTEKALESKRKNDNVDAPAKKQKKLQKTCSLNSDEAFDDSNQNFGSLQSAEVYHEVRKSLSVLTSPSRKPSVPEKRNHVEVVADQSPSKNCELVVGKKYTAVIKKIKEFQMDILINGRIPGRIHITEAANSVREAVKPFKKYSKGNNIEVWVIGFHEKQSHNFLVLSHCQMKTYVECSLFEHPPAPLHPAYSIGDHVKGFIREIDNTVISVWLNPQTIATLPLYHMKADFKTLCRPSKHYHSGDVLKVQVFSTSDEIELTQLGSWKPKAGMNIIGLIQMVSADKGISVKLPHGYSGEVHLTDIRDSYISADRVLYPLLRKGLVQCHILEVSDDDTKFCRLSTRPSRLTHSDRRPEDPELSGNDIECGVVVRGFVKRITNSGLVILLGRNLEGIISTLTMEPNEKNDILKAHSIGSVVRVKVDSDREEKLSLSIVYEHTDKTDLLHNSLAKTERRKRKAVALEDTSLKLKSQISSQEPRIVVENPEQPSPSIKPFPCLQVSKGFNFDAHTVALDLKMLAQSFSDSSDDDSQKQDKKKHERYHVLNEKDIFERENLLIDKNQLPGTADEFEELVKGSPNMAALWVRYMVFHLEQMDIDSARNIAERALKTISFRDEEEKLKIWIAFLNLENLYGTQESLQEVFERALPLNEPSKLYNAMVDIYSRSNKIADAENMYHIMVKKFHLNKEAWINFGLFYMKTGRPELARKVMDRSLKSLDQKHHIDIIGKFAEMEFKHGDVELGKTIFDDVLKNYPKRTDLWSIYIDLLIKFGDLSAVRKLFERVTSMKLSARKMKFFFKRYLTFERQHGTAESCSEIVRKASDYFKSDNIEWTK